MFHQWQCEHGVEAEAGMVELQNKEKQKNNLLGMAIGVVRSRHFFLKVALPAIPLHIRHV
jgi:hypothetical protein